MGPLVSQPGHDPRPVAKFPSTSKAKMSAMFSNAQDTTPYRTALSKMSHPQTNNACTADIIKDMVKQCPSKVWRPHNNAIYTFST